MKISGASSPTKCDVHRDVEGGVLRTTKNADEVIRQRKCKKCGRKFDTIEISQDVMVERTVAAADKLEVALNVMLKYKNILLMVQTVQTVEAAIRREITSTLEGTAETTDAADSDA